MWVDEKIYEKISIVNNKKNVISMDLIKPIEWIEHLEEFDQAYMLHYDQQMLVEEMKLVRE